VPEVEYVPYGPPEAGQRPACELVATFGDLEPEYAAIRRGAGVFDSPHRGTLLITGADRRDFLNRMVTQELKDLEAGAVKPTFWLNRKGRIEADLLLIELGDRMFVDVDVHRVEHTAATLSEFVFTEDVAIADVTGSFHHIAVHGPLAGAAMRAAGPRDLDLEAPGAAVVGVGGVEVVVARRDQTGETGLELIAPYDKAAIVWDGLMGAADTVGEGGRRVRPVGWYALNIARIEAGTPLFNIDFGPASLPHETGVLHDRVSFTKGCYLGQEIVARTENLGRAKQVLVGLRPTRDLLPVAGEAVFALGDAQQPKAGPQIGVVTSSTPSPMLGSVPIAFAMLRSSHAEPGTTVLVIAEGELAEAAVGGLRFLPPSGPAESPPGRGESA
jgi:folate-binding protein YgfZ